MPPAQFGQFTASELYCPKCRRSQPVRERLLLVLPTGELYEYRCAECATSLAERTVSAPPGGVPHRPSPHRSRSPRRLWR